VNQSVKRGNKSFKVKRLKRITSSGGPVCDGRKILSEESPFEVFDRVICRAIGKLMSDGQVSRTGGVRLINALMHENQAKLFQLI